jgi:beta-1,4-mannosyltransferase
MIEVFRRIEDENLSLHVRGASIDPELSSAIETIASSDPRVVAVLRHASDDELRDEIGQAELVVLPYREMHNSGALLLALSLDRPVLAPLSESTRLLSDEVGPGWVILYDGELTPGVVKDALEQRKKRIADHPDLSARDWPALGVALSDVYERARAR